MYVTGSPARWFQVLALALVTLTIPARLFAQAPTFNALITTPTNSGSAIPATAAVGDFNGDGRLDALVGDLSSDLRLMLGNGNGTFSANTIGAVGANIYAVRAADFNGDGRLDAVAASNQGASTVLINTGNNVSGVPQFTVTNYAGGDRSATVGDLNGDGRPDFILGNCCSGVSVFLNNPLAPGTFIASQATNITGPGGPSVGGGAIADLNGDGNADYVVASSQSPTTNVFFGNGNGTLQAPVEIPSFAFTVIAADVNNDGAPDLLEVDGASLRAYLNAGGGVFGSPIAYSLPGAGSVAAADINGDGNIDAVVGNASFDKSQILLGDGSGSFGAVHEFPANNNPRDVAVGDFNGDGKLDVGTAGLDDRTYGVLLNTTVFAPPLPTQTLTILGGSGNPGDIAANVEYYNPATGQWQPAYLANYAPDHPITHPWGNVPGTTRWINYKTSGASDPGASDINRLQYLYRVRFTVPDDAVNPTMTFSLKADNFAQVAINGVAAGGLITGQANQVNVDAVFSQNVLVGENTITLNIGDEGGLNGFNFRIDLSMQSSEPIEIVPVIPDTTAPVITAPADIVEEATSADGATATFTATAIDDKDGAVSVAANPASGSTFSTGPTTVNLSASDQAGNTATASFTVTVQDTTAPVVSVPVNIVAEATSDSGAAVSYPAPTATDVVGVVSLTSNPPSGSTFGLGSTTVSTVAVDAAGNRGSATFTITVVDTTAPAIASVTPSQATLWPPNHKMVAITVNAVATDAVGVTSLKIISVTSSEPDNGLGDGDTAGDAVITGPLSVNLRAERGGKGNGRTYTITVKARDDAGNASTTTCTVFVPKSKGK